VLHGNGDGEERWWLGLVKFVWRSNYERSVGGTIEDNVPAMISFGPYQEYLKSDELLWKDSICGRGWGLKNLRDLRGF
jgi:hypothetical protein